MPRTLFAQQNAESGTVLLQELSTIMEAHLASEAATAEEKSRTDTAVAEVMGEGGEGEGEGRRSGGEEGEKRRRHVAAFTAKMLESSRKYGGKSMLYHGKL